MKKITVIILFCLPFIAVMGQGKKVNIATELNRLASFYDLPSYLSDTKIKQFSSYDTTGGNDDGFSGKYSFLRRNPDSSLVIFEAKGKGVINRIWTPTPTNDTLDFYFGGKKKPAFSIRFADLFSGKVFPFVAPLTGNEIGGYYSYIPIPFHDGCKIVFRGKKLQFYQIQYRTYPKAYEVEDFRLNWDEAANKALSTVKQRWEKPGQIVSEITPIHRDTVLSAGQSLTLADITQGGRILGIQLSPADVFSGLDKQIDLKITWDNEQQPAVYMPVADFFGYAFGNISMQSLLLGTAERVNYCYFPMPFAKHAKIELIYRRPANGILAEPVRITSAVYVSDEAYNPTKEGKFYAYWNPNKNAALGQPHMLLAGKGEGHYVGTLLQAQGLEPGMTLFFEGDDVTHIDGEMRVHGTGSEDYFNGGWYALLDRWDRSMSLPLHGALDYSLPFARTGGYRLFLSDKMPFTNEILHTIEHGPEPNNKPVDYTSVALYYASKAITQGQEKPTNDLTKIYMPDTLMVYPQLMKYSIAGTVKISGDILESATGGQIKIDLADLPHGTYQLLADVEKMPEGGEITIWQRQKQVSEPFSCYADQKVTSTHALCNVRIDQFKNAITLHFKADQTKSKICIRRLIFIRKPH